MTDRNVDGLSNAKHMVRWFTLAHSRRGMNFEIQEWSYIKAISHTSKSLINLLAYSWNDKLCIYLHKYAIQLHMFGWAVINFVFIQDGRWRAKRLYCAQETSDGQRPWPNAGERLKEGGKTIQDNLKNGDAMCCISLNRAKNLLRTNDRDLCFYGKPESKTIALKHSSKHPYHWGSL